MKTSGQGWHQQTPEIDGGAPILAPGAKVKCCKMAEGGGAHQLLQRRYSRHDDAWRPELAQHDGVVPVDAVSWRPEGAGMCARPLEAGEFSVKMIKNEYSRGSRLTRISYLSSIFRKYGGGKRMRTTKLKRIIDGPMKLAGIRATMGLMWASGSDSNRSFAETGAIRGLLGGE
jgi:hypothetical protein